MKYIIENKPMKIIVFLLFTLSFTILYSFFEDYNFTGFNKVEQVIKDEIIKEEVKDEVSEEVNENSNQEKKDIINVNKSKTNYAGFEPFITSEDYTKEKEKDIAINEKTEEVDIELDKQELSKSKIKPSIYERLFNRLYFSISTGGLLGYGDVYPNSTSIKLISMLQVFSTICLIVF